MSKKPRRTMGEEWSRTIRAQLLEMEQDYNGKANIRLVTRPNERGHPRLFVSVSFTFTAKFLDTPDTIYYGEEYGGDRWLGLEPQLSHMLYHLANLCHRQQTGDGTFTRLVALPALK